HTVGPSNLDEETYEPQITFIINENNIITQQSFQKSFQTVTPTSCNSNKNNNGDANYHHNAYHENVYLLSMNDMTSPPSISHPHGFYSGPSSLAHSPQSLPIFSCEKNIFLNSSFDNKNVLRDPCLVETFYDTAKYHIDDKSKDANFNTSPLIEFTTCEQEPLAPLFDLLDNNNENIQEQVAFVILRHPFTVGHLFPPRKSELQNSQFPVLSLTFLILSCKSFPFQLKFLHSPAQFYRRLVFRLNN
ncbi:7360_t:CDS:2, partial [Entrophospora sp. SA101]